MKEYRCGTILSSIGVHFGHGHPDNVSRIVFSVYDNNVAEAKAVLEALNIASNNDVKKIRIFTDSQSTIDIINSPKVQELYRRKQANVPLPLAAKGTRLYFKCPCTFNLIFDHIHSSFDDVEIIFVKGHNDVGLFGQEGNTAADRLAFEALEAAAANAGLRNKTSK